MEIRKTFYSAGQACYTYYETLHSSKLIMFQNKLECLSLPVNSALVYNIFNRHRSLPLKRLRSYPRVQILD
jgi:hypothetical protein